MQKLYGSQDSCWGRSSIYTCRRPGPRSGPVHLPSYKPKVSNDLECTASLMSCKWQADDSWSCQSHSRCTNVSRALMTCMLRNILELKPQHSDKHRSQTWTVGLLSIINPPRSDVEALPQKHTTYCRGTNKQPRFFGLEIDLGPLTKPLLSKLCCRCLLYTWATLGRSISGKVRVTLKAGSGKHEHKRIFHDSLRSGDSMTEHRQAKLEECRDRKYAGEVRLECDGLNRSHGNTVPAPAAGICLHFFMVAEIRLSVDTLNCRKQECSYDYVLWTGVLDSALRLATLQGTFLQRQRLKDHLALHPKFQTCSSGWDKRQYSQYQEPSIFHPEIIEVSCWQATERCTSESVMKLHSLCHDNNNQKFCSLSRITPATALQYGCVFGMCNNRRWIFRDMDTDPEVAKLREEICAKYYRLAFDSHDALPSDANAALQTPAGCRHSLARVAQEHYCPRMHQRLIHASIDSVRTGEYTSLGQDTSEPNPIYHECCLSVGYTHEVAMHSAPDPSTVVSALPMQSRLGSRPSPKSGGSTVRLLLLIILRKTTAVAGVKVVTSATGVTGGECNLPSVEAMPKHSGERDNTARQAKASSICPHVKRSYKRACRRAAGPEGGAWYRGKWMSKIQLNAVYTTNSERKVATTRQTIRPYRDAEVNLAQASAKTRRWKVLSWNAGGLGACWDQLMIFLDASQFDIVTVCETKWGFTSEWHTDKWWCIHNGKENSADGQGGLLILISKRVCQQLSIQFNHISPGRLTHVRVTQHLCNVDIIACYQKAWSGRDCLPIRAELWAHLQHVLGSCSQRNHVLLLGDLNTSHAPQGPCFGPACKAPTTGQATDYAHLYSILQEFDLVALNTWTKASCHTYSWGKTRTLIDYIIIRRRHADRIARSSTPAFDLPFVSPNLSAALHWPVIASVPIHWPAIISRPPAKPTFNMEALLQDLSQPHSHRLEEFRSSSALSLESATDLQSWHDNLMRNAALHYPPARVNGRLQIWQGTTIQRAVRDMWQQFRLMRSIHDRGVAGIFAKWRAWRAFQQMHKQYRKAGREARRRRMNVLLVEAENAANRHDLRSLYAITKRIAPKCRKCRLNIKGKQGELLTHAQMVLLMAGHFRTRFEATKAAEKRFNAHTRTLMDDWSPDVETILRELRSIPLRKAVPTHLAPGCLWRACADIVAPKLHRFMAQVWTTGPITVPRLWSDSWLCFILKPGKKGHSPKDYRPIGLQCPIGKASITAVASTIKMSVHAALRSFPQFGYMPGRDAGAALARVFNHCNTVRQLCQSHASSVHDLRAGQTRHKLIGGLQILLDLEQAFDKVPRYLLHRSLTKLGISGPEVEILLQWHLESHCHIVEGDQQQVFRTGRGVRQGCKAAPLLWLAFTGCICTEMDEELGPGWCRRHLTLYADDHHIGFIFRSAEELGSAVRATTALLRVLKKLNMSVSLSKTVAIFTYRGTMSGMVRKTYTKMRKNGRVLCLDDGTELPIVQQHVYLGAIVSYQNYEDMTVRHRLSLAKVQYDRLRRILNNRRSLTRTQRLCMWRTCVETVMMYAIPLCQHRQSSIDCIQTQMMKQIRAITKQPVHLTRVPDAELLASVGIHPPIVYCIEALKRRLQRATVDADPFIHGSTWQEIILHMQALQHGLEQVPVPPTVMLPCPQCGQQFADQKALRVHQSRAHDRKLEVTAKFDMAQHALNGMPICKACGKKFERKDGLRRHVNHSRCSVLNAESSTQTVPGPKPARSPPPETVPQTEPANISLRLVIAEDPNFRRAVQGFTRQQLVSIPEILTLKQTCIYCGQWIASPWQMKNHFHNSHSDIAKLHFKKARKLAAAFVPSKPCTFCEATVTQPGKHLKSCPVLFQLCMAKCCQDLQTASQDNGAIRDRGGLREVVETESEKQHGRWPGRPEQIPQGRLQGTGTGLEVKTTGRRRGVWSDAGHIDAASGEGRHPSGRQYQGVTTERSFCLTRPGTVRLPITHTNASQNHRGVEENQRPGDGFALEKGATPSSIVAMPAEGSPGEAPERNHAEEFQGAGMVGRTGVAFSSLVPSREETYDLGQASGPSAGSPSVHRPTHERSGFSGHGPPLRGHTPASRGDARPHRDISSRCWLPQPGQLACSGDSQTARELRDMASRGSAVALADTSAEQHRATAAEGPAVPLASVNAALSQILSLRLVNPSQQCYMNSCFIACTWSLSHLDTHDRIRYGEGADAVADVLGTQQCTLQSRPAWRELIHGWEDQGRQQDVADLWCHLVGRLRSPSLEGRWQTRVIRAGAARTVDSSALRQPIKLPMLESTMPCSLQEIINRWHRQDGYQALAHAPSAVVLQLDRFCMARLHVYKNSSPVTWHLIIKMPYFTQAEDVTTTWIEYTIRSVILHHGDSPDVGHYTCVLHRRNTHLSTDDGRQPQRLRHVTGKHHKSCYLFVATRV